MEDSGDRVGDGKAARWNRRLAMHECKDRRMEWGVDREVEVCVVVD